MILHRITTIFAGIARDFTGQNHAQLAEQYGIPLPLVFQTVATAHAIKKYSRMKQDRALLDIAVRISELTRKPDGCQALTTAQTMLIANMVRTGGAVDVSPAKVIPLGISALGFNLEAPSIGDYSAPRKAARTASPSSVSTRQQLLDQATQRQVALSQEVLHQVSPESQGQQQDEATHGPAHLPDPQVGQSVQMTSHFSGG
ncbi:MAG TPA: hypothetical protein VFW42_10860 [Fluviicoccus sp.]|nr:hypothetical protein [Fluviicoccus sp.]